MSTSVKPIYSCTECPWKGREPIQAECPTCPDCGAPVAPYRSPAQRKTASAIAAALVGSLPLWGCSSLPPVDPNVCMRAGRIGNVRTMTITHCELLRIEGGDERAEVRP